MATGLQSRWFTLCGRPEQPIVTAQWEELYNAYTQPYRHYHNLTHLEQLFRLYDVYEAHLRNKEVIQFALFFHDLVYEPGSNSNETESAALAGRFLNRLRYPAAIREKVQEYILATNDHFTAAAADNDLCFFLDFDLSILAAEPDQYATYRLNIWKEYSKYHEERFVKARCVFVTKCLHVPAIFKTETLRKAFAVKAKANLEQEAKELGCFYETG